MASGALAAYLVQNDFIQRESFGRIAIEQGHFMGRPSLVRARIEKHGSIIRRVEVGGAARVSFRGRMMVP
jgi:predicted PhzF superfamily epimerase YddE/YHI9